MERRGWVTAAVVLAVPAAAFAGTNGSARKDACGLLMRAEVAAAIGEPVATIQGQGTATGALYCNWTGKDSHLVSAGINLIAATDNAAARYKSYLALNKKATTPVPGIGVAAVTDGKVILARSAKAFIQIGASRDMALAKLEALAKKALARA